MILGKFFKQYYGKFSETSIEIFHASFLLRYSKQYTISCGNFSEKFFQNIDISVINFLNQYFHKLAQIFSVRLREMLRKHSHNYYREGFWNFSEIFCEWFGQRTQTFDEMFWQVCGNIYWNISRTLLVKILEMIHKIFINFSENFLEISISRSQTFWTNISTNLQKYFP